MKWLAGTSGYSYKAWKGNFYPADLPADQMLGHYARQLPAVEINNTFYRMPRKTVLENWAAAVPAEFRFVIKASRRITHQQRLKDAGEAAGYLFDAVGALGDRLGAVLFQLPPNLRADRERLAAFLELIPAGVPTAFEFRHPSWDDAAIHALLRDHGVALCIADDESDEARDVLATAPWVYLRLRRPEYTDASLQAWRAGAAASGAESGFAFFKHEDDGAGPAMANRFLRMADTRPRKAPKPAAAKSRPAAAQPGATRPPKRA